MIVGIGVDSKGRKHVLGLRGGASEYAKVCTGLLEDLVERGVKPGRRRLFVIDGSKALRKAIDAVYGQENPVQRCRNHKRKNVLDHVPDSMKDTVKATMNAAYRLDGDKGMARLEELAKMLYRLHPSVANDPSPCEWSFDREPIRPCPYSSLPNAPTQCCSSDYDEKYLPSKPGADPIVFRAI